MAMYRRLASGREEPAELNLLVPMVTITDDREAGLQPLVDHLPDLTMEQALELPMTLVGTLDQITAQLRAQRERYGFSYLTVMEPEMEAFAPVIAELRGE
uniref:hypothetical protein n=1 Tax=Streptomyces asoensis TaxID=249586 RepID=UPI001C0EBDA1